MRFKEVLLKPVFRVQRSLTNREVKLSCIRVCGLFSTLRRLDILPCARATEARSTEARRGQGLMHVAMHIVNERCIL